MGVYMDVMPWLRIRIVHRIELKITDAFLSLNHALGLTLLGGPA